jgi:integrase
MPKLSADRLPAYCHHKQSGQATVTLDGRDICLGKHGTAESRAKYNRLIGEWQANGRSLPSHDKDLMVVEVVDRFWTYAQSYYVYADGTPTSEQDTIRQAIRPLNLMYGRTPAAEFGPLALKGLRAQMTKPSVVENAKTGKVEQRRGWSRSFTNKQISRIKHVFQWAVGEQLIPPSVHHALMAVEGLRRGRSDARETEPVKPVAEAHIDAVLPFVSKQVGAMIELQQVTGARGGELFIMRPCDIEIAGPVWVYRPSQHKTLHHGHTREIRLGRRAQKIIEPFLGNRPTTGYLFSPIDAEADRRATLTANRKTPLSCGNRPGTNKARKPTRTITETYTKDSYARAITRACEKADKWAKGGKVISNDHVCVPHWHPHQIRHTAATRLRHEYGLEAAQVILGQKTLTVTQVYAEKNVALADRIMAEVG